MGSAGSKGRDSFAPSGRTRRDATRSKDCRRPCYLAVAVDYVTEVMWSDPDYLESLRPRAVKFTLGDDESKTVPLTLATP